MSHRATASWAAGAVLVAAAGWLAFGASGGPGETDQSVPARLGFDASTSAAVSHPLPPPTVPELVFPQRVLPENTPSTSAAAAPPTSGPGPTTTTSTTTMSGPSGSSQDAPSEPAHTVTSIEPVAEPGPLIGVHVDDVPFQGLELLTRVEEAIGPVEVVHWYQAWGGGHRTFRHDWLDSVADSGRLGLITWEPWALTGEAVQPSFAPPTISSGDHDDYIRSWASGFAARQDGPWFIRPMHEMNGNWYPWSGGVTGGEPADFIAAWRHIHDVFAEAGATNVRWVWCPLADDVSGRFEEFYPGTEYVDVLCLDGYNWGAGNASYGGWRSPEQIFGGALGRISVLGAQPIWIGEVGSAPDGGDKAQWLTQLLTLKDPRLEAVVFFNLDKERDWRVDRDPAVASAVRANR